MESTVYIYKCENYDISKIYKLIEKSVNDLGGTNKLFNKGNRILLKPNLLAPETPEKATTTHPAVFEAAARFFIDSGFQITYGDSPGFHSAETTAKKAGLKKVADNLGIKLADFKNSYKVFVKDAVQNKYFNIARGIQEADAIVSLPKLKTHALTTITGAIKNQFGCIPGREKSSYHVKLDEIDKFCQMLVDLNLYLRPKLYIMDGILAMEGNGPHRGTPVKTGVLLISNDPVALDSVASRVIDLSPERVITTVKGHQSGLGTMVNYKIKGDITSLPIKKFKLPKRDIFISLPRWFRKSLDEFLISKPVYDYSKCTKCYECYEICPTDPKSIYIRDDKYPAYNYRTCIKCYCCQETCPTGAIYLKIMPFRR